MGILTVSRQLGSGGDVIAKLVAQSLNWNLLDHSALEALDSQITKFKEAGKTLDLKNVQPDSLKKIERTKKIYKINIVN